jgi:hypothetical protein
MFSLKGTDCPDSESTMEKAGRGERRRKRERRREKILNKMEGGVGEGNLGFAAAKSV